MIIVTGEVELHPEDAWPAMFHVMSMMEASAAEDGCLSFRIYSDLVNPRRFRLYEEWRDEAALAAHFASPHVIEFQERLKAFRVIDRKISKFEVVEATSI